MCEGEWMHVSGCRGCDTVCSTYVCPHEMIIEYVIMYVLYVLYICRVSGHSVHSVHSYILRRTSHYSLSNT